MDHGHSKKLIVMSLIAVLVALVLAKLFEIDALLLLLLLCPIMMIVMMVRMDDNHKH